MRWFLSRRDAEAVPVRSHEADQPEGTGSAAFAEDLRTALPEPQIEEPTKRMHLASMAEAARPSATPARSATSKRGASRHPTPRRNPVLKSLAAKITVIAVAVAASVGGLASADALPRTVQHGVAQVADRVGLNLPDPADDHEAEPNDEPGDHENEPVEDQNEPAQQENEPGDDQNEGQPGNDDNQDENEPAQDPNEGEDQAGDDQNEGEDPSGNDDNQGENDDQQGDDQNEGPGGGTDDQGGQGDEGSSGDEDGGSGGSGGSGGEGGGD